METSEVVIVGAGPAGLNAALMLGRARRQVVVVDDGAPRNAVSLQMHGFLSRDGLSPRTFLQRGRRELARYPNVAVLRESIVDAQREAETFTLATASGQRLQAKRLLLATGVRDDVPEVEGMDAFWGRSVFVCPYCDGWECRDRRIAVYGSLRDAVELTQELHQWTKTISICAPRMEPIPEQSRQWLEAATIVVTIGRLQRLIGRYGGLHAIELDDKRQIPCDALFLSAAMSQRSSLPEVLGCEIDGPSIKIDDAGRTTVPGCYAAGDAVTLHHQVILAAASGVRAAIALNSDLSVENAASLTSS